MASRLQGHRERRRSQALSVPSGNRGSTHCSLYMIYTPYSDRSADTCICLASATMKAPLIVCAAGSRRFEQPRCRFRCPLCTSAPARPFPSAPPFVSSASCPEATACVALADLAAPPSRRVRPGRERVAARRSSNAPPHSSQRAASERRRRKRNASRFHTAAFDVTFQRCSV
eukprot:6181245-Pleurochrysis_carterae.AAC.3